MDPSPNGISEPLVVPGPSDQATRPAVIIVVSKIPFDEYFTLEYTVNGKKISYEVEAGDEARKWFKDHGVNDTIRLNKSLDEAWNFYYTEIEIPGHLWKEPVLPHPAYQPKV